jgi:hypothetical protein
MTVSRINARFTLLLTALMAAAQAAAAPPNVTYLFPAGASRGDVLEVKAGGSFDHWPASVWVAGDGLEVKAAVEKGKLAVRVAADAAPGLRWIRLYDHEGAATPRPFIVGTLAERLEVEPNDTLAQAQLLDSARLTVNGTLARNGDVDCYAVRLAAGETLVASMEANRRLGSPMDGLLQVVSPDGFVLLQNDDDPLLDPRLVFEAPEDGTFVIRAFAFPAVAAASISFAGAETFIYRLMLTTGGYADHVYPLAVRSGAPAQVEVRGWNLPEEARFLEVPVAAALPSLELHHLLLANTALVRLEAEETLAEVELEGGGGAAADVLLSFPVPATTSGRIDPAGDEDLFAFRAAKGQRLLIEVRSRRLGSPLDPVLEVLDGEGKKLAEADDSGGSRDPEMSFTAPEDGEYRIKVRDLHGRGGFRYVYCLRLSTPEPDFNLSLSSDSFVLTPGKPLDIPVAVARRHGFRGEIEVTVLGLPRGVEAAPALSPAEGEASKSVEVRLETAATGAPLWGPIRIIGAARGESALSRAATAPLPGDGASTAEVWLTVASAADPGK